MKSESSGFLKDTSGLQMYGVIGHNIRRRCHILRRKEEKDYKTEADISKSYD